MLSIKNVISHPLTTLIGLLTGALVAGINAAVATFAQTHDVTDWKPYAAAAVSAAVPVIIGAIMPDPTRVSVTPILGQEFIQGFANNQAAPPDLVTHLQLLTDNANQAHDALKQFTEMSTLLAGLLGATTAPTLRSIGNELPPEQVAGTSFGPARPGQEGAIKE